MQRTGWFHRLAGKVQNELFYRLNKNKYHFLGRGVILEKPTRVDGRKNISIGKNTVIKRNTWIFAMDKSGGMPILKIGQGCAIGHANHITAVEQVVIGDQVLTASNVFISDNTHEYRDIRVPIMDQKVLFRKEVKIGDGSWLGENVCVIGASVGRNCVIGANSVVTRDIPDFCVAVGAPAKVISRFDSRTKKWQKIKGKK